MRSPLAVLRLLVCTAVLLGAAGISAAWADPSSNAASSEVRYQLPIAGAAVLDPFDADIGTYDAGHRGVDLRAGPAVVVAASADGTVAFAGPVAGRGVVVLLHADGVRTTYEPVEPVVRAGQSVRAGEPVGTVSGLHGDFGEGAVLHWGARRGEVYLDPLSLLRPLGPVRLIR